MAMTLRDFKEIWCVDFEFGCQHGQNPEPRCLVAKEVHSGKLIRLWLDSKNPLPCPPYEMGESTLFVAFFSSAELLCHKVLGWPYPANTLDLYVEFRNMVNGKNTLCGNGLIGALTWFGLPTIDSAEKDEMRSLALRGGTYNQDEKESLLDYCESDVKALDLLLREMAPRIDLPRALLRGEYMSCVAEMEYNGIPIDSVALECLCYHQDFLKETLVHKLDRESRIYEGTKFRRDRFEQWLADQGIPWPRLASGQLNLADETFREFERIHHQVAPIRAMRSFLSNLRLLDLPVGEDGRNRCMLSPYRSRTGRNQPSNSRFVFGPPSWIRSLIRPPEGKALAYLDFNQQEFAIAAVLSKDSNMIEAYNSGDPYLAFAKQAGAVPQDASKRSHRAERDQYKACVLAVQYGMGANSLALRIGKSPEDARVLLEAHRRTYRVFWEWSDNLVNFGLLKGHLFTTFGWTVQIGENPNERFIRNYAMQANGAEMLRLGIILAMDKGIKVVAPIHDAILIEASRDELDFAVQTAKDAMVEASCLVLDGFPLRVDATIVESPNRYRDERGAEMWRKVWEVIRDQAPDQESRTLAGQILEDEAA